MPTLPGRVLFGAAYYHEYQPSPRLEKDLDLMREARFSVIRVGESVWSTWEPEDGVFALEWLRPVLDGAHERGISVILGTPTYAVPPWLARLHPEINAERRTGQPMGWGIRQEMDFTHPAFLFHAERVIRRIVAHYADHPAVIGYQVDNEPGIEIFHNRAVFQRFVDQLRRVYGSVDEINERWGLTYWSHRLSTWADLWTPDANGQPQYDLAWRRFQAGLTSDFIGWQADVVREYAREDQFVTTCIAYSRPTVRDDHLTARLDVTAGNPYYRMQDGLALPSTEPTSDSWASTGTWALYAAADRMFASRQEPFLVTETDAQAIGPAWINEPAYDGQWRQAAWALVSRGARMIEYWHWHTLHHGTETYWGGILPHSGAPGRVYRELAALGAEFEKAGELVAGLEPDADVTMLYSADTKWALEHAPMLHGPDGGPDRRAYHAVFDAFYRGAFDAGLQTRIVHPSQLFGRDPAEVAAERPLLVAAGLLVAAEDELRWLERYAAAGGHLLLGIRTGYGDEEVRARQETKPAFLTEAAGVWYDEFSTLSDPLPVLAPDASPLRLPGGARGTRWVDGLTVADGEVLALYEHPHFCRWPAVTTRAHGAGRVTYVGTVPDQALAAAVLAWCAPPREEEGWRPAADSQTVTAATAPNGARVRFLHNWSWLPSTFRLPTPCRDALTGAPLPAESELELGPWDVRVLRDALRAGERRGGAAVT
ncbi:beta-galactosidase [Streptomyces radicis]|uniref:beta-galactosidase n=1 Tax=Streptomyces radicis TaxID=1750517 RepID=A0A3A9W3U2_9ACTN|nr:beta-galactosidase [Streptomyces radicis]RKN07848.1 beta-galactosidase [Streptomyces radicis]RKN20698.1 beta-galactosidase [Streptomyces radicis]